MSAVNRMKEGGILIGLIVAILVVGVISAAMVKGLKSQAVTSVRAYNLMRARYAAEAGYNYFSSRSIEAKKAFLGDGVTVFSMKNGDRFAITVTTNSAYSGWLFVDILGQTLSANQVVATRPFNFKVPPSGGNDEIVSDGDDLLDLVDIDAIPDPTHKNKGKGNDKVDLKKLDDLILIKDKAKGKGKGKRGNEEDLKKWRKTYEEVLAVHEVFKVEELPTGSGGTSSKLRSDLDIRHAEIDTSPGTTDHLIWNVVLPLDYHDKAIAALNEDGYLNYEVQTKISWQFEGNGESENNLIQGAQGIAFKLHEVGENAGGILSQFYAVSFMRYEGVETGGNLLGQADLSDTDNTYIEVYSDLDFYLTGENKLDGYWGSWNCIPNAIKPLAGVEGTAFRMLVLWKQWIDDNDAPQRAWLAYKRLYRIDRRVLDTTIHIRAIEGIEESSGKEFVDVQMRLGDSVAGTGNGSRIDEYRYPYLNADDYSPVPGIFPYWPPLDPSDWMSANDYYTDAQPIINSDRFSSAELRRLGDSETIRIYDANVNYLFKNQANPLGDLGFIFNGNFLSGLNTDLLNKDGNLEKHVDPADVDLPSLYMAVDDLAIKWLSITESTGESGSDVITDF